MRVIVKNEGIVLRKTDFRTTSIILTLYTKDFGKIKGVVKGVRGSRPVSFGLPEIFTLNEIVFYQSKRDICYISHCDLIDYFKTIRNNFDSSIYASYAVDIFDAVTGMNQPNIGLFNLLCSYLQALNTDLNQRLATTVFEIKLLTLAGIGPRLDSCASCGGSVNENEHVFSIINGGLVCEKCSGRDSSRIKLSKKNVHFLRNTAESNWEDSLKVQNASDIGLEKMLKNFVNYHLQPGIKSAEFLNLVEKI